VHQKHNANTLARNGIEPTSEAKLLFPGLARFYETMLPIAATFVRIVVVTVLRLCELVRSPSIRSALDRSSDTLLAFALRAVDRLLCDHSRPHPETINLLWGVLDDPHLNKALGLPQNSRSFGPYQRRR
jgi:hypothetical protein